MSPRVPKWYLVVVGAVAVQRLAELSLSRSNESGIRGVRAASSTYPLMLLAHLGLVTLPLVEVALRGSVRLWDSESTSGRSWRCGIVTQ